MDSHPLITVPDYYWVIIASNNFKGVVEVIILQCVIEQNGKHVVVHVHV